MKKLFAILAIASVMTACNNDSAKTETPAADTSKAASPAVDAAQTADTASKMMADTTHKVADTAAKK